jgi:hypothetical protein
MKNFFRNLLLGEHSEQSGGYCRLNAELEQSYTLLVGTNQLGRSI